MPNVMDNLAEGSAAVRQFQQNVYGAQYDQQNIDEAAKQMQLKTQAESVKIEQEKALTDKTRIESLLFADKKATSDAGKVALEKASQTPEWQKAVAEKDDAAIARLASIALFPVDADKGEKFQMQAESLESKQLANEVKQGELNRQTIAEARAAIIAADAKDIPGLLGKMTDKQKLAIKARIPGFFEENNPELQKKQLDELFMSADKEAAKNIALIRAQTTIRAHEIDKERSAAHDNALLIAKIAGIVGKDGKNSESAVVKEASKYDAKVQADERIAAKELASASEAVKAAQKTIDNNHLYDTDAERKTLERATENYWKIKKGMLDKRRTYLSSLPEDSAEYIERESLLEQELQEAKDNAPQLFPKENKATPTTDKPTSGSGSGATVPSNTREGSGSSASSPIKITSAEEAKSAQEGKYYDTPKGVMQFKDGKFVPVSAATPDKTSTKEDSPRTKKLKEHMAKEAALSEEQQKKSLAEQAAFIKKKAEEEAEQRKKEAQWHKDAMASLINPDAHKRKKPNEQEK